MKTKPNTRSGKAAPAKINAPASAATETVTIERELADELAKEEITQAAHSMGLFYKESKKISYRGLFEHMRRQAGFTLDKEDIDEACKHMNRYCALTARTNTPELQHIDQTVNETTAKLSSQQLIWVKKAADIMSCRPDELLHAAAFAFLDMEHVDGPRQKMADTFAAIQDFAISGNVPAKSPEEIFLGKEAE